MGVVSCGTTMLDQGVFENIGAVTWDTTVKTAGFTAVSGNGYFCNTTSAAFTVTLPSSPSAGDIVGIKDYANTADTNNITIGRNSSPIQGTAADFIIDTEGRSVLLVYVDATKGWLVTSASQASDISNPTFTIATGGTITTSGDYKIHTFTSPGTFTVTAVGNAPTVPAGGPSNADYLVVAGGGGGSTDIGGGGGAGGHRTSYPSPAGTIPVSVTGYPITVGAGGSGSPTPGGSGSQGGSSIFSSITSAGGGLAKASPNAGGTGGSGGGGSSNTGAGGAGNTPPVSPPQGNPGGDSINPGSFNERAGGGGGAGGAGSPGTSTGGPGGNGTANSITGSPVTRAGGGGGGAGSAIAGGSGGPGGGGQGGGLGSNSRQAVAGTANTGGGGGGGGSSNPPSNAPPSGTASLGRSGGSGIVIIRYKFQ
jgi:hypothetical protein